DGLHDGVRFATNGDGTGEIVVREWFDGAKNVSPAVLPHSQERRAAGGRLLEFAVAIAVGLFAVGGQEIGPTGTHVAGHMLDDDGDGVHLLVERGKKLVIGHLVDGALGHDLVLTEEDERVLEVGGSELVRHPPIFGSIVAERYQGVDGGGAASGNEAGEERD